MQPILSVNQIGVMNGARALLADVSLLVHPGELIAVVGPNGAGKTSLLRAIAGDVPLAHGEISLRGRDLSSWEPRSRARHLAILPQLSLLNFPYRVDEVVALGRIPHNTGNALDDNIVAKAMEVMDITHLRQRRYPELSGGEKQRVQLARVIGQIWRSEDADPRLALFDEPNTALDLGHQKLVMGALVNLARSGVGILMVIHDINVALRYADRIIALLDGKMLAEGAIDDVISESLLQQLFATDIRLVTHPDDGTRYVLV